MSKNINNVLINEVLQIRSDLSMPPDFHWTELFEKKDFKVLRRDI